MSKEFDELLRQLAYIQDNPRGVKLAQRPTWDTDQEYLFKLADIVASQLPRVESVRNAVASMINSGKYSAKNLRILARRLPNIAKKLDEGNVWGRIDYISLTEPDALRNIFGLSQDVEDVFNKYATLLSQAADSVVNKKYRQARMRLNYVMKGLNTNINELRKMYESFSGSAFEEEKEEQLNQSQKPKQQTKPKTRPGRDRTRELREWGAAGRNLQRWEQIRKTLVPGDYLLHARTNQKMVWDGNNFR